jgi:hypothetical protein
MENKKDLLAFSDGTYVFQESEDENQFFFFRKDGEVIGEIDREPMDMYQNYIVTKMFDGDFFNQIVANNLRFDTSDDGKCIRITSFAIGEKDPLERKENKGILRLLKSPFGRKKNK